MYVELAAGGFILGRYVYHRWVADWLGWGPADPKPVREIRVPISEEGAPVPLIYGRCLVDRPILAWLGVPHSAFVDPDDAEPKGTYPLVIGQHIYRCNMFFNLGIGFPNGTQRIHRMWAGGLELLNPPIADSVAMSVLTGDGNFEHLGHTLVAYGVPSVVAPCLVSTRTTGAETTGIVTEGKIEFLNGNSNQTLVDPVTLEPTTNAGYRMTEPGLDDNVPSEEVPGYRGYLSVFLSNQIGASPHGDDWAFGTSPAPTAYSWEASSYPADQLGPSDRIGFEANPADVIYDLLTGTFGKLGISAHLVDVDSFAVAAATLAAEEHGYSRALDELEEAGELIMGILRQIDGVIYEDPTDTKIKIKLVRGDYDPNTVPLITPSSCREIQGYAAGGWLNVVNKIRVVFPDRQIQYRDNSVVAMNTANAVGQDNQVREAQLRFPGVCTSALAEELASRELSARSRPIAKCSAIVDRSFYRTVTGDVVALTWPEYGISGMLFRVAGVDRGTLENGEIRLDLIQDFFYSHRGSVIGGGGRVGSFPVLVGGAYFTAIDLATAGDRAALDVILRLEDPGTAGYAIEFTLIAGAALEVGVMLYGSTILVSLTYDDGVTIVATALAALAAALLASGLGIVLDGTASSPSLVLRDDATVGALTSSSMWLHVE